MNPSANREHDFLNAILESTGALLVVLDHEGRIRRFNRACEILSGYTFAEVEGKFPWDTFLPPEDADAIRRDATEAFAGNPRATTDQHTHYWKTKTGTRRLIEWSNTVLRDHAGNLEFTVCLGTDITERRKSEEEVQRLAAIVKNSQDFIGISDIEGRALYLNDAGRNLVGIRDDDHFRSTHVPDYFADDDREKLGNEILPDLMSRGRWVGDVHFRHFQTGREIPVSFDIFRIDDPVTAKPINFATVTQDITERKRYETHINASNQLLSAVLDTTPVLIAYLDRDMNFVRVNAAYAAADEKSADFFIGKNHFDLFPNTENEAIFRRVVETGTAHVTKAKPFQYEHNPERGVTHWDWTLTPIKDNDGEVGGLVLSLTNVTDRIEALEAVQRSEQELKLLNEALKARVIEHTAEGLLQAQRNEMILNTTPDGFFAADMDGQIRAANPAFCAMLGYAKDELLQLSIPEIEANENPQDVAAHMAKIFAEGHDRFDSRHRRKDGGEVDVEITTMLVEIGGEKMFYAFARDITARKESEAALSRALREAKRANKAKSEFLSRMSHELRTPMNAILGFAQLLEFEPIGEEPLGFAREIRHAGDHLLDLINELLDLSRIESGKLSVSVQPLKLHPPVADAVQIVQPMLERKSITLRNKIDPRAVALADPTRLKQILVNLLSNAAKYNRIEGSIDIDCRLTSEGRLRISVMDTGQGIAPEKLSLVFTPFERLGAEFSEIDGTGIGLALSRQLAELMDGTLGVESALGQGSTFWLELPATQAQPEQPATSAMTQPANDDQHTLLYVEDNPANLRVVEGIIRHHPRLRLLSATDGEHGLELARRHRPDVILLDIHLPGMDGFAVLAALKADTATRNIPLIALSADAMPLDIEKGLAAGFAHYLTKPIVIDEFLKTVDGCLRKSGKQNRQ